MGAGVEQRASGSTHRLASERIVPERGEITARKLRLLVEQYRPRLGHYEVITLGNNVGYIIKKVRPQDQVVDIPKEEERDVLLGDFDDAMGATTAIKGKPNGEDVGKRTRFEWYKNHVQGLGIVISDGQAKEVIDETDAFSRWEHVPGGGPIYHQREHAAVLTRVTEQMLWKDPSEVAGTVGEIVSTLKRIKSGEREAADPFYFNQNGLLVMRQKDSPWEQQMEEMFMNTMIKPPYYPEVLSAMKEVNAMNDGMDLFGMTHGDPTEQLRKFFELMVDDPEIDMEEIWLTQVKKGDFVQQVVKDRGLRKSVYVHFDDSPTHIAQTVSFSDQIGGVLSVRDETKEGQNLLKGKTQIPTDLVAEGRVAVIRFSEGNEISETSEDIVDQIQRIRANVRARMGRGIDAVAVSAA